MNSKRVPDTEHAELDVERVRGGGLRLVAAIAAIGPKQDDPAPSPPAVRAAVWRYLEAIGPKQDDPAPPPPSQLRDLLAATRRMIQAIGPKQDDPLARAMHAGAVAAFAVAIGPKQDDPRPPPPQTRAFLAWAARYVVR